MSDFSNKIDSLLLKNHMRRIDLVRATGINESTIRGWNNRTPSVENAIIIAKFFNMSVEELWTGETFEALALIDEETEFIKYYRMFDNRDKNDVMEYVRMKAKHYQK